jgi:hypothetical protein
MTKLAFAARSHIRNAVLCTLLTLGLAACGADSGTTASTTGAVVQPNVGLINRTPVVATTSPTPATNTSTVASNQGSTTPVAIPPVTAVVTPPVKVVSSGAATLDWTPPTENSDGSVLTNLAGYTVYYGTSPDSLTQSVKLSNPGLTAYTLSNLTSGTWYFAVTSYSSAGVESNRSGVISTKI